MAKKKEEFKLPPGTPAPWMSTFSDLMTLLMCFFVLLFASSSVDVAKFDAIAQSFQQTFSIFKAGAKAVGDGILISNGVSQLNMLDEYINNTGKVAESDSNAEDFKEEDTESSSTSKEVSELAEQLDISEEEAASLEEALEKLEQEKLEMSEEMAEKIEESLNEAFLQDKVEVEFNANYVLLTLNGAFLFDSGQAELKKEAYPILDRIGIILAKYADSTIEIEGHTDSVPLNGGRYENNDVLSSYRALSVFNYLRDVAKIDPELMKHSGRGEYLPVADNQTPEGRALNRRVEIKVYNALSAY